MADILTKTFNFGGADRYVLAPDAANVIEDAEHRFVTDAEKAEWNAKSNFSGNYNDLTNKPTIPAAPDLTQYYTKVEVDALFKLDSTTLI